MDAPTATAGNPSASLGCVALHAGRAGNKGTAITFIAPDDERYAPDLVKALRESGGARRPRTCLL